MGCFLPEGDGTKVFEDFVGNGQVLDQQITDTICRQQILHTEFVQRLQFSLRCRVVGQDLMHVHVFLGILLAREEGVDEADCCYDIEADLVRDFGVHDCIVNGAPRPQQSGVHDGASQVLHLAFLRVGQENGVGDDTVREGFQVQPSGPNLCKTKRVEDLCEIGSVGRLSTAKQADPACLLGSWVDVARDDFDDWPPLADDVFHDNLVLLFCSHGLVLEKTGRAQYFQRTFVLCYAAVFEVAPLSCEDSQLVLLVFQERAFGGHELEGKAAILFI
mmetsp:Transcript_87457/g.183036  ORF Transcript_87457/g.183036 Transcript_87457/m.183036 type:complete len:275 (-) Transcript_87457:858-1682(-)